MRHRLLLTSLVAVTISVVASAAVPNAFVAGQPASANQVNQNFQYLDQRAGDAIGALLTPAVSGSSSISSGVTSVACPANTLVLSASCGCSNASGTRNFGILFSCTVSGNGAVVGCFSDGLTFNPSLPPPRADVRAVCLGGLQVDGSPLFTSPVGKIDQDGADLQGAEADLRKHEEARARALTGE